MVVKDETKIQCFFPTWLVCDALCQQFLQALGDHASDMIIAEHYAIDEIDSHRNTVSNENVLSASCSRFDKFLIFLRVCVCVFLGAHAPQTAPWTLQEAPLPFAGAVSATAIS